jgi:hypothetical protein
MTDPRDSMRLGDGPYEVERWDEPDPPNDGTAESSSLRVWILVDRTSATSAVGYFRDEALARRVAALLNFAHRAEQAS